MILHRSQVKDLRKANSGLGAANADLCTILKRQGAKTARQAAGTNARVNSLQQELDEERKLRQAVEARAQELQQELDEERKLRQAVQVRAQRLAVTVEELRATAAMTFPTIKEDAAHASSPSEVKTLMSRCRNIQEQSIGQRPGERFISRRCVQRVYQQGGTTQSTSEATWRFLANYGRTTTVRLYNGHRGVSDVNCHTDMDDLAGELHPLSTEYVELAGLFNSAGIEEMSFSTSGSSSTARHEACEGRSTHESLLDGLVQVYNKYHPSAAAEFVAQGRTY